MATPDPLSSGARKTSRSSAGRVLEKIDQRECIDDTLPLTATILTYKILQSHVEYVIRVSRGPVIEGSWDVSLCTYYLCYHHPSIHSFTPMITCTLL
jgi:hypothetical protein